MGQVSEGVVSTRGNGVHYVRYGTATAKLIKMDEKLYSLSNLWAGVKRQGHGTGVMRNAIELADAMGFKIVLSVQRYGGRSHEGMDNKQLQAFYEKFGFVAPPGQSLPIVMFREPNSQEKLIS